MKRALLLAVLSLVAFSPSLSAAGLPVAGRVVGPDGKPFPNVRVALVPYPSLAEAGKLEIAGKATPEPVTAVTTGADGAFLLTAPETGMWRVRVEAQGFVPLEALLLPLLEATELADAQLVADARLLVRLTNAQGRPVTGARVRVEDTRNAMRMPDSWRAGRRLAVTGADGTATVPRGAGELLTVQAGTSGLPVAKADGVTGAAVSLRLEPGRMRQAVARDSKGRPAAGGVLFLGDFEWPLTIASETGLAEVSLPGTAGLDLNVAAADGRRIAWRLRPARPEETGPAAIVLPEAVPVTARVLSSRDGRPVAGALVWPSADYGRLLRSGADGTVRLPTLASGSEDAVEAAAPGFFPEEANGSAGRAPTLSLQPKLAASGVVVDEAGRPVAGAALKATFQPGARMRLSPAVYGSGGFTRSGPSGRFRLPSLAAATAYELKVTRTGFAPARLELPAREPGQPAPELRIVLKTGRGVFGLVVDAGRRPVAGARVSMVAARSDDFMARIRAARDPEPPPGGTTDAAGRFEVRNLPAGSYDLQVRARGFARLTVPGLGVPEGTGSTDLGTVVMAPGLAVLGMVADAQGRPVEGAEVRARAATRDPMDLPMNRDPGPADTVTAADGSFALEDRSPGESLDLTASHAGFGPGTAPGVAVPSEAPVRIVLNANARVSGRAVDPDGRPVARASIFVSEQRSMSMGGQSMITSSGRFHRATSDEDGAFSVADVSPGQIRVSARAPRRQPAEIEGLEVKAGQDLTGVDVVLRPGASVEGRVLAPDGTPVREAQVSVTQASPSDFTSFSPLSATTDGDGRYQIDGVPPGPQTLEAHAEGYRRAARDVEVAAGNSTVDFRLERGLEVSGRVMDDAGNPLQGVQIILVAGRNFMDAPRGASGGDGTFRLGGVQDGTYRVSARREGYVALDPQAQMVTVAGAPVSGLEVRLSAGGTLVGKLSGLDLSQLSRVVILADGTLNRGRVDPEGNYRIQHVSPGTWTVSATVPDTPLHAEGKVKLEPGAPEARLDLQFGGGHELRGVVLSNGAPLAGASLTLTATGTTTLQTAMTDHQGGFRFGGLEDGTYKLDVSTPKGAQHQESVEIAGNREIRVELRTASLAGRVIDAQDASPVQGVEISIQSTAEGAFPTFNSVTSDAKGNFRILEVGDGSWKLRALCEGYATTERELRVEDGAAPEEVEIRMEPTEGITVEAVLPSGQPPERLRVAALGPDGRTVMSGNYPTGENGRTRLSNVPPGRWNLLIESDQSAPVVAAASVPGPQVRAVLPPAGQLRIQIPALAAGSATAKVVLTGTGGLYRAIDWDGTVKSEWELYNGQHTFTRVAPGIWQAVARTPDGRTFTGTVTVIPGGTAEGVLK